MTIILDVFSGLPNPQWELPPAEARLFREALQRLPPTSAPPAFIPPLGYRGVQVIDDDGQEIATLFGGLASTTAQRRSDPGRQLEAQLLQSGRGHLDDSLLAEVLTEVNPRP